MYRIQRPNGMWITRSVPTDDCNLDSLDAAKRLAQRVARDTRGYGEFLIYESGQDIAVESVSIGPSDK